MNSAIIVDDEDPPVPLIIGDVHKWLSFVVLAVQRKQARGLAHILYVADHPVIDPFALPS